MVSAPSVELRRFTRDEFLRMIELGLFRADEHLELLHGRLIVVPPQGPPHTYSSSVLRDRLLAAYAGKASVREDKPLDCGQEELPEPDLAVVRGTHRDYAERHPRGNESVLVVEVSRTTQDVDRDKAMVYARAGVSVYWLLDIATRRLEVYSRAASDRYALVRVLGETDEIEVPETSETWVVRELLPP